MKRYEVVEIEEEDFDEIEQGMTDERAIEVLKKLPEGWFAYRRPSWGGAKEFDLEQFEICCAIWHAIERLEGGKE